ncbi:MAG: NADPH-dependent assimilatory sulfite reductase hemoprotein subunit [Phycisphaeraceae bacterium]|nr:NADPH-dependent assimilatory sulfite reductase hemoprotein subunit [Phycisphaeraceae bacterium]
MSESSPAGDAKSFGRTMRSEESAVEKAKKASNYLRGSIQQTLDDQAVKEFTHDDQALLKFHGIYQQEDRDARAKAKETGIEPETWFMVRTRLPGGWMNAAQYRALDDLATKFTYNQSLRITTRQGFQYHGVVKGNLHAVLKGVNDSLVTTLAACGDVGRNVMASPAPLKDQAHQQLLELAKRISTELLPKSIAYFEIWVNGEKHSDSNTGKGDEPFYGPAYLPRKFKVGIALPEDNSIDVYTQDCGLIAVVRGNKIVGVNVLAGGGLGMTHRKADTFARMASHIGYVDVEHAVEAMRTVAAIFRDHGNRADRRHARLKYVIEEKGVEWFQQEFRSRVNFELKPWVDVGPLQLNDYLGRHEQGDGKLFYGVWVENGRVMDYPETGPKYKTAFRAIVDRFGCDVVLTPNQSLLFANLTAEQVAALEAILAQHKVRRLGELTLLRRYSMACPALPTCGLALAESERILPGMLDELEGEFERLGLIDQPLTVRMTGCPNGCARPYTADLAFVGRKPGVYDIFVGGRLAGDRLAELYADNVEEKQVVESLRPLLTRWSKEKRGEESLGDYYERVFGDGKPRTVLTGDKHTPALERVGQAE